MKQPKLHTGFRSAQQAVLAKGPDTAQPVVAQVPANVPKQPKPVASKKAKPKGPPFGGKAAPLFVKKAARY